jgi:molybdopterin-guanine dinucleotide biosynthesis protein A
MIRTKRFLHFGGNLFFLFPLYYSEIKVSACDMPYIRQETVENMIAYVHEQFDGILSSHFGCLQPLVGIYHRRTLEILSNCSRHKTIV